MEVTLDLTAVAIEAEQADINLEAEVSEQPLRRRIVAVSEGVHNFQSHFGLISTVEKI